VKIIEAKEVCKDYYIGKDKVSVIKDITLEVKEGDFVSIVGPSGSGKSTLLYLLSGMEPLSSGTVELLGNDLHKLSDAKLSQVRQEDVGFIFQFYNLVGEMTVEDNVLLPSLIGKKKIDKKRLDEVISMVGLNGQRKQFPNELSGGQQQRTAIARVIYHNPKVIFADEPTGNLDSKNSIEVMQLLQDINKKYDTTIVLVTHDETQIHSGNRVLRLVDGKIELDCEVK